jgi:hypothetical protein
MAHNGAGELYEKARLVWDYFTRGGVDVDGLGRIFSRLCNQLHTPSLVAVAQESGLRHYYGQVEAVLAEAWQLNEKRTVYEAIRHAILTGEPLPTPEQHAERSASAVCYWLDRLAAKLLEEESQGRYRLREEYQQEKAYTPIFDEVVNEAGRDGNYRTITRALDLAIERRAPEVGGLEPHWQPHRRNLQTFARFLVEYAEEQGR